MQLLHPGTNLDAKENLKHMASTLLRALPADFADLRRGTIAAWTHDTAYVTPRKEGHDE